MANKYTRRILQGEITTFKEYAELCFAYFVIKESLNSEKDNNHHTNQIEMAKKLLNAADLRSDEELVAIQKFKLEESKRAYIKIIEKKKALRITLDKFLTDAKAWQPPTADHQEIKDFMIQQLEITINHNCDLRHYLSMLKWIENELPTINAQTIRDEKIKEYNELIAYHERRLLREQREEAEVTKFETDFLNSLTTI